MITCHVSIECEGSAFHDDNDTWDPAPELASILRSAAAEGEGMPSRSVAGMPPNLYDPNTSDDIRRAIREVTER